MSIILKVVVFDFVANRDMSIWRQQAKWKFGYTTQANKAKVSLFMTVWKAWYREREREAVESGTPCQCDPLKDTLTLLTPHVYKDPWKYNAWPNQNETVSLSLSLSVPLWFMHSWGECCLVRDHSLGTLLKQLLNDLGPGFIPPNSREALYGDW